MSDFPLDPPMSKMLIMSEHYQCSVEILIIVSMLSVPSVFMPSRDKPEEADAARDKFMVPESDHLSLMNIYNQWKFSNHSPKWCLDNFLYAKVYIIVKYTFYRD